MRKIKILYLEDEPFLGKIVKETLERREFTVIMINDGKDAVEGFKKAAPDVCVLDVMVPSKDGYSIAKEIRHLGSLVPIVFVTAKIQTDDLLKGFESGGNDYIRKPFSMEELIVRIYNLLKITNASTPSAIRENIAIGAYTFLPLRYELRLGSEIKKLSHRECTLLQMLLDNQNATVLRKDILMKLWGDDSFFNSRNLDVYIKKLRDYFKQDSAVEIITIKGIGYHFVVI